MGCRSVRVTWGALDALLRQIADAGGNMTLYRQQYWKSGRWRLRMGPGDALAFGGNCP